MPALPLFLVVCVTDDGGGAVEIGCVLESSPVLSGMLRHFHLDFAAGSGAECLKEVGCCSVGCCEVVGGGQMDLRV